MGVKNANLTSAEMQTIRSMAECGLVMSLAAKHAPFARNTVLYHVKQIKIKTGLDARKFYDMEKLLEIIGDET